MVSLRVDISSSRACTSSGLYRTNRLPNRTAFRRPRFSRFMTVCEHTLRTSAVCLRVQSLCSCVRSRDNIKSYDVMIH